VADFNRYVPTNRFTLTKKIRNARRTQMGNTAEISRILFVMFIIIIFLCLFNQTIKIICVHRTIESKRSRIFFFHWPGDGQGDLRPVLKFRDTTNNKMVDHLKITHKDTFCTLKTTRNHNIIEKVIRQYGVCVPGFTLE
jgi:hypothetical protein